MVSGERLWSRVRSVCGGASGGFGGDGGWPLSDAPPAAKRARWARNSARGGRPVVVKKVYWVVGAAGLEVLPPRRRSSGSRQPLNGGHDVNPYRGPRRSAAGGDADDRSDTDLIKLGIELSVEPAGG